MGISHNRMKTTIRKEYTRRVRLILKSQLNSRNKFMAINSLAVPVVTYGFGIVNWTNAELKNLDRKTRKLLTIHRSHHPKADVDRIYLKRAEGGRGLLQIEMSEKTSIIGLNSYLESTRDWMMKCVRLHEMNKKLYSVTRKTTKYQSQLSYEEPIFDVSNPATVNAKVAKQAAKKAETKQLHQNWEQKPLHGKFAQRCKQADVDHESTFAWLKSSGLKGETEGFILAAQDQSLKTKNYIANIMKAGGNASCRYCHSYQETIDHLCSGCPILARTEYLTRHNKVAQHVHWKICKHYGLESSDKWYEHQTPPVVENDKAVVLWDFSIHTDRTIKANRPDIVIRDKMKKTCWLLDVSIPTDTNTSVKTFEKLAKYKDLEIELTKSWGVTIKTVPVIIGALGIINKSTQKYLQMIPGDVTFYELQKTTLLGTSNILRKALSLNAL